VPNVPRQVSLAGEVGRSQKTGAKALGLLFCQQALCPERWNVKSVFIETPYGPAINWTSLLAHILLPTCDIIAIASFIALVLSERVCPR